ncbi:VQ motif-containing protein 10-like [Phalaenopsis equestris]|uniref:VQ motif-containing protein 10-like n=1 Tax=Phalaenopsis equestris TaxID=78828 RepID=UPI0009E214CF|nr:VQ motif-containing protein 10-like [Phalaenopsis equestris]
MSGHEQNQMKVKFIVTKFVETDEAQFKSVVQSLTGKDAVTEDSDCGGDGGSKKEVTGGGTEDRPRKSLEDKDSAFVTECSPTMDELFELLGE